MAENPDLVKLPKAAGISRRDPFECAIHQENC